MKYYPRILMLFFLLGCSGGLLAQRGHGSLYSYFGAGSFTYDNYGMAKRLGGVGSAVRSPYFLNSINPASQNSIAIPFTFQVEGDVSYNYQQMTTDKESLNSNYSNLNSIQLWMRFSQKSALSLGLSPITVQDYSFSDEVNFEGLADRYNRIYKGWGNTNKVYLNYAYSLGSRFSVGIRPSFLFANFQKSSTYLNVNEAGYVSETKGLMTGLGLEAGVQWDMISKEDKKLTWGLNSSHFSKLSGTSNSVISTYVENQVLYNDEEKEVSLQLPSNLRTGLAYQNKSWLFAADFTQSIGENLYSNQLANQVYSAGLEFISDYSGSKLIHSMSFSLGGRYDIGAVQVNGTPVSSYALTSGIGVPVNRSARINLSYQYQRTGAVDLMSLETTHSITLHFTFGDRWFQKYVFD